MSYIFVQVNMGKDLFVVTGNNLGIACNFFVLLKRMQDGYLNRQGCANQGT